MTVAVITGSAGLVGSEAAEYFCEQGMDVVGIDNDMRKRFFGDDASTRWQRERLQRRLGPRYRHLDIDVRDVEQIEQTFRHYGRQIGLVIHTAAQPSHDWAVKSPLSDFSVNAGGTLNLLEATRRFSPDAVLIFTSTNKVYGGLPNTLPPV